MVTISTRNSVIFYMEFETVKLESFPGVKMNSLGLNLEKSELGKISHINNGNR